MGDLDSIPGLGRCPGEGNSYLPPVFWPGEIHGLYLIHGVAKSWKQLSYFNFASLHTCTHTAAAAAAAAAAKSLQSCPTLCDPIEGSPPGSPIPRCWEPAYCILSEDL